MTSFPDGFLWGAASAAHQNEGGNVNADLWPQEWAPGSGFAEPSGDACDSYHRYPEDIALLAGAGLSAYRFGIEWARIEPEEGWFSRAETDHYRRMLATCHEHGVTPIPTLHHFTTPRWFPWRGGWTDPGAPDRFARFADWVGTRLGDLIPYACTINESNLIASLVHVGMAPLADRDETPDMGQPDAEVNRDVERAAEMEKLEEALARAESGEGPVGPSGTGWPAVDVEVMAAAHRKAADALKAASSGTQVGWTLALIDVQAVEGGEERRDRAVQAAQLDWLDVSADDDFVGVQTYSRERMGPDGLLPRPTDRPATQTGWEVYPEALEHTVRLAAGRVDVPILVTENGMATSDDAARIAYTTEALRGLGRCVDDGIDVRGYLHWTLLDNWEWTSGFRMTFGLTAVDRETFARTPKPSLGWLGSVARANRID